MAQTSVGNIPLLTRRNRLGDLTIPATGGRVTYPIDTARNIHAIYLLWTITGTPATEAQMKAQIGDVRVRIGGKVILDMTATEILDLYHYFNDGNALGALVFAGQLPLVFLPYMLPLTNESQQYAIGMLSDRDKSKRNTCTVEVNMIGTVTVNACEVQLETDDLPSDTIGYHIRWTKYGTTWAAASKQTLDKIDLESNALAVLGYHVHHTAGTMTREALRVNDVEVVSDTPVILNNFLLNRAGRAPVALYEHIDFSLANHTMAFLDVSRLINQYLDLTWSVAPNGYNILIQSLCKNL